MTINEAAAQSGFSADTLKYYERIGLIRPVPRKSYGRRDYGRRETEQLELIKQLKEMEMPLASIRRYLALNAQGGAALKEKIKLLEQERDAMRERAKRLSDGAVKAEELIARALGQPAASRTTPAACRSASRATSAPRA